jgi:hypothetical protein
VLAVIGVGALAYYAWATRQVSGTARAVTGAIPQ